MKTKTIKYVLLLALLSLGFILAACGSNSQAEESAAVSEPEGNLAFVDSAAIEEANAHKYVVVNGNYPDSCTKISKVVQTLEGNEFNIILYTDKPADLVCAQMMSPFTVSILLEVGGLVPGEYTVSVNGSASTMLTIGS